MGNNHFAGHSVQSDRDSNRFRSWRRNRTSTFAIASRAPAHIESMQREHHQIVDQYLREIDTELGRSAAGVCGRDSQFGRSGSGGEVAKSLGSQCG